MNGKHKDTFYRGWVRFLASRKQKKQCVLAGDPLKQGLKHRLRLLLRHSDLSSVTDIYPEYYDDMMGSYLIIDPSGRLVDNSQGKHQYSDCILDIGFQRALDQVRVSPVKFHKRQLPREYPNIFTETISERR